MLPAGGSPKINATVRSRTLAGSGGMRDGRVLSCKRPATPACMNRSCQRHTVTLLVPVRCMISLVPTRQQHDPRSSNMFAGCFGPQ
jgi:hypothetical protein